MNDDEARHPNEWDIKAIAEACGPKLFEDLINTLTQQCRPHDDTA